MKWYSLAAFTALASFAPAEDLLFVETLVGLELSEAQSLGFTTTTVTEAEFRALKTSDFTAYKAIIFGDDFGSSDLTNIQFIEDTKDVWTYGALLLQVIS
jgi:hypothetical protein